MERSELIGKIEAHNVPEYLRIYAHSIKNTKDYKALEGLATDGVATIKITLLPNGVHVEATETFENQFKLAQNQIKSLKDDLKNGQTELNKAKKTVSNQEKEIVALKSEVKNLKAEAKKTVKKVTPYEDTDS